jgi:hypothetical protein
VIPLGGAGRGRRGECFAQGGGGGGHRSWPGKAGDVGGDLGFAGEGVKGREGEAEAGLGRSDRPRT